MLDELAANRKQLLIILGLVLIVVAGLAVMLWRHLAPQSANEILIQPSSSNIVNSPQEEPAKILVHISGAVSRPGVYRLSSDDRVLDAIKLSGGALPNADLSVINLAEKVKDQQKIIVPEKIIVAPPAANGSEQTSQAKNNRQTNSQISVSLNIATEAELRQVKGIGPVTAKKIIEYRQANGPFCRLEDLMKVKGIGKGKFAKIKDRISL